MTSREINILKKAEDILDRETMNLDISEDAEYDYYTDMVATALCALAEVLDQLRTR